MPEAPFVPVIPAGGAGTRLWPLSRRARPKFLLDLTGQGTSLLQDTVSRLAPLADAPPVVVTGAMHRAAVREQLGGPEVARIVAEPSPRNSMPAIALAAALIEREHPGAVLGSFAADHLIGDREAFARAVAVARDAAAQGYLVTLGIQPTHPATGFGYIERSAGDAASGPDSPARPDRPLARPGGPGALPAGAHGVDRFVEKPDRERAEEFLASGRFLWNAGMFLARASWLLDELALQLPALAAGVREIAAAHGTAQEGAVLERVWPRLTAIAIDHALAEPLAAEGKVAVVPASVGWDDVGDFAALARQLRERPDGTRAASGDGADDGDVRVLGGAQVDAVSSRATVYGSTDRHIALVGLDGISIVDTEDALLVLADAQAQDLSRLVARLEGHGLDRLR
ncbi:mannose-1-phosphate guanylyltransferase [Brachybacterium saurashtrense]|uniref:Mannose-1-phosphate guanylyltransferase n=1 Tax=Brachybacterium saurashtrense TaxID=556288 RepID=A0A345YNS5_9MICO|nr:sugar phosphate nucleotidyltransferase [Brachybacterium saurashtrense]AXK45577.1 mannose-1-phosphate guanylyltransferase [Brachybacterium saurashtrense]RRR21052.1 mannose-1-phosphate guanylyltransferase [Brachybacterium saurashtrense]